jgi:hypothetical protein
VEHLVHQELVEHQVQMEQNGTSGQMVQMEHQVQVEHQVQMEQMELMVGTSGTSGSNGTNGTSGSSGTSGSAIINSNADNRVITGSNSAGQLNGETQFTFDGVTATLNGALIVGTSTTSTTVGIIRASNDVIAFASSDERLKENITSITNPIDKINQIGGYEYDWIPMEGIHENEGHDIGVIAQEIEKVLPEIVTRRDNGYLAVKYERIVALLIECVKEQQVQIDELKNKLDNIQ